MTDPDKPQDDATADSVDDGESGSDKSQGWKPPRDGSWIPKQRFDEAVLKERQERERYEAMLVQEREARIRAEERLTKAPPEKQMTRADLTALVDAGKITQEQADQEYDRIREERLRSEIARDLEAKGRAAQREQTFKALLTQYRDLVPELAQAGSEKRNAVAAEFRYQVDVLGEPDNMETEVKACRAVLGPPERIREITRSRRESNADGGGGGGDAEPSGRGKFAGLPNHVRSHYAKMIERGMYSGWEDPSLKRELEFARRKARTSSAA